MSDHLLGITVSTSKVKSTHILQCTRRLRASRPNLLFCNVNIHIWPISVRPIHIIGYLVSVSCLHVSK